tara:strand:+ start:5024 stop:5536 length:513 start_codon:yes stop_codon:yes gene_type:complete
MACVLTQGFTKGCKDSTGGIQEFYLSVRPTNFAVSKNASGQVTSYTGTVAWYKYVPRKQTSTFGESIETSEENGTVFFKQTAQIVLTKMEVGKQNEVKLLAQADLLLISKDQNGFYWLHGVENGVNLATSEAVAGKAYGDLNGYTLNFEAMEPSNMPTIYYPAFSTQITG